MWISSTPPSLVGLSNASNSVLVISVAFASRGVSEKPCHSPAVSMPRNRCQAMALVPEQRAQSLRLAQHVRVVAAGEAAVAGQDQDRGPLRVLRLADQRVVDLR
jgi:hypothetical protein